jgi:cell wall-associated NlpC family hydrolase
MAGSKGISGLALALATAGGLLLVSAIKNVSIVDALRDVIGGKAPGTTQGTPTGPALSSTKTNVDQAIAAAAVGAAGGSVLGSTLGTSGTASLPGQGIGAAAADNAQGVLGAKYRWGGTDPKTGVDCSGLVVWALRVSGIPNLPRLTTTTFLTWSGATTIPRAQCARGDLVIWSGHMGIASDNQTMIEAPHTGDVVKFANIDKEFRVQPVIRRVKG